MRFLIYVTDTFRQTSITWWWFYRWDHIGQSALGNVKKFQNTQNPLFNWRNILLMMHHTIWYQACWIFTITSDSWSLQPHSPPRRIIQWPDHHVVCLHSTPLHDINWMLEKTHKNEKWITKYEYTNLPGFQACSTPQSRITCSVFPFAANTCSPP